MDVVEGLNAVTSLVASIGEFMRSFAPGFIFLSCMNFAANRKREDKVEYLIISCIALSFLISVLSDLLAEWSSVFNTLVWAVVLSTLGGLAVGKLRRTGWINRLSGRVFRRDFRDDFLTYLWDVPQEDDSLVVRIKRKNDSYVYVGQIKKILNPLDSPVLILDNYTKHKGRKTVQEGSWKGGQSHLAVNYNDIVSFEYRIVKKGENSAAPPAKKDAPC